MTAQIGRLLTTIYGWRWFVLPPITGAAMLAMIVGALVVAPREAVEGEVQRLFYIHVPSAMASYLAFTIVFIASVMVLWRRDMRWDSVARGAATVGVLFTAFTLVTGAIWGKPIWGTWWAWDARLTSTLILFMIYTGYLLARSLADEGDEQAARFAAVFAIIGFLDIPIINMSVRWWRTLHPQPIVAQLPGSQSLPDSMLAVLALGMVAIIMLALWLIVLRSEAEAMSSRVQAARARVDRRERSRWTT